MPRGLLRHIPAGFEGHIVPLRAIRGHGKGGREITIFVKGFLGRHDRPGDFEGWLDAHSRTHFMGDCIGWKWGSGKVFEWQRMIPMPLLTLAGVATRRISLTPNGFLAATIGEAGITGIRMYAQYRNAVNNAHAEATALAAFLEASRQTYSTVRIIAHSLGCQLVLNALRFPDTKRPDYVHMCAPAVTEERVKEILEGGIASQAARIYYSERDLVLSTAFRLLEQGEALGTTGLLGEYQGILDKDVTEYFNTRIGVHGEYENLFPEFFEEHESL
ncbi:hypothetical protein AAMO2058_001635100 [Amorphochlora amoebiformis]